MHPCPLHDVMRRARPTGTPSPGTGALSNIQSIVTAHYNIQYIVHVKVL